MSFVLAVSLIFIGAIIIASAMRKQTIASFIQDTLKGKSGSSSGGSF